MFLLFILKEIAVGIAQIIWAILEYLFTVVFGSIVICIMWTLTKLGFWRMPTFPDLKGHFQLPWSH